MANFCKLFVLVIYVLGAHVVPLVHHHIHQVDEASVVLAENSQDELGQGKCRCVSGCRSKASLVRTTEKHLDRYQLTATESRSAHSCGDTCTICIVQSLPSGVCVPALEAFSSSEPVSLTNYESALFLIDVLTGLPGQRGPPIADDLSSLSA